jgi:hypothetical protein
MWCFGIHVCIFPVIWVSYCAIACVDGCSNGFLLFVSLIFCYFSEIVFVMNLSTFQLYSFWCIITKVLPLSAFVTVRLFCFIFFFMLLMSFFFCISCYFMCYSLSFCDSLCLLVFVVCWLLFVSCMLVHLGWVGLLQYRLLLLVFGSNCFVGDVNCILSLYLGVVFICLWIWC